MRSFIRRFGKVLFFIVLALAASGGIAYLVSRSFDVQNIEVVGTHLTVSVDEQKLYRNLLFFPTQKVRSQILRDNPMLRDIRIQKKFPHTLVIVAYQRVPVARLVAGDHEVVVDSDDFVVGIASSGNAALPLISLPAGSVAVGARITDQSIVAAIMFITDARELNATSVSRFDSTSMSARIGETDIYFTQTDDIAAKVSTLQTIIAGFRIKGNLPKVIDLRFDKPVVTF